MRGKKRHPDIVIYHIHQAIEKLLKATLLVAKGDVHFSHDLERLHSLLVAKQPIYSDIEDDIILLHAYYPRLRYPKSDFIDEGDLDKGFSIYKKLLKILSKEAVLKRHRGDL